jgi:hypothetical protein
MQTIPEPTSEQVKAREALEKIKMAWFAFKVVLWTFVGTTVAVVTILFLPFITAPAKIIIGVIESLLTLCLRAILSYLFPKPKSN